MILPHWRLGIWSILIKIKNWIWDLLLLSSSPIQDLNIRLFPVIMIYEYYYGLLLICTLFQNGTSKIASKWLFWSNWINNRLILIYMFFNELNITENKILSLLLLSIWLNIICTRAKRKHPFGYKYPSIQMKLDIHYWHMHTQWCQTVDCFTDL